MLNTDKLTSSSNLKGGAAHEMMHALQWAVKTAARQVDYGWMRDAMANWAIDQVYGQSLQTEQQYADCYTSTPELSLDDRSKGHCSRFSDAARDYGAYLFFQFVAKTLGPAAVKNCWDATASASTSFAAVDTGLAGAGGLKKQWPLFAKTLWNKPPIDTKANSFKQWDALNDTPKTIDKPADLGGAPEGNDTLDTELPSLSIRYYHFTFSDSNTRSVLFHNGFFDQAQAGKAISVLAMWTDSTGQWVEEDDWSTYRDVGLCRDLKNQRASDLIIIVASAETDPGGTVTATEAPYLKRNNMGCYRYEGTAEALDHYSTWTGTGKVATSNLAFQIPPGTDAVDAKNPGFPDTLRVGMTSVTALTGTDVTFTESYGTGTCSFSFGPATFPLTAGAPAQGILQLNPFPELKPVPGALQDWISGPERAYIAAGVDTQLVTVNVSGTACGPTAQDVVGVILSTSDENDPKLVSQNGSIQDTYTLGEMTFVWSLSPKAEP